MSATEDVEVVVCGGGPAGMASALSLARLGFSQIVILEQHPSDWSPDCVQSPTYCLDFHSLKWFRLMGLEGALKEASVLYDHTSLMIKADNEQKVVPMPDREFDNDTYFISRTDILHFLKEKIDTEFKGKIEMRFETLVKSVKRDPTNLNSGFTVSLFPAKGQPYNMVAPFVIGTSGAQTHVQEVMKELVPKFHKTTVPFLNVGKRWKAMRLMIPQELIPSKKYATCIAKDGGLLVVFPEHAHKHRGAVCMFEKLDFNDGAELYEYLHENFPWVPWRDALEKELAESFATHAGQCTGPVEYASRLQAACGKGGACLVGNAVDVAPPCLAQGINSAINDVAALHEAIEAGMAVEDEEGQKIGSCIADILAAYEKSHLRCEQAVSKLMPLGYPCQYPGSPDETLHKSVWSWDANMRNTLHKYCSALFSPPVIKLLQDPSLSYADVLNRYNATTRNVAISCTVVAAGTAAVGAMCVSSFLKYAKSNSSSS